MPSPRFCGYGHNPAIPGAALAKTPIVCILNIFWNRFQPDKFRFRPSRQPDLPPISNGLALWPPFRCMLG
jgi:hypothetical protein